MKHNLCAAVAVTALSSSAPALAQDANADDLRCVAVFAVAAGQAKDSAIQGPLIAGTMYFIGRLDGRAPGLDLEARLKAEALHMEEKGLFATESKRCGETIGARGKDLMKIGEALKAAGKKP